MAMQLQQELPIPLGAINTDVDPVVDAGTRENELSYDAPPTTAPPATTHQAPPSDQRPPSQDRGIADTGRQASQRSLTSRIRSWAITTTALTNLALVMGGMVIAFVFGNVAQRQGNKSLDATLWRNCIDLPDTIGNTTTCQRLLAKGFDSLQKREFPGDDQVLRARLNDVVSEMFDLLAVLQDRKRALAGRPSTPPLSPPAPVRVPWQIWIPLRLVFFCFYNASGLVVDISMRAGRDFILATCMWMFFIHAAHQMFPSARSSELFKFAIFLLAIPTSSGIQSNMTNITGWGSPIEPWKLYFRPIIFTRLFLIVKDHQYVPRLLKQARDIDERAASKGWGFPWTVAWMYVDIFSECNPGSAGQWKELAGTAILVVADNLYSRLRAHLRSRKQQQSGHRQDDGVNQAAEA